jgi:hypothetical protein
MCDEIENGMKSCGAHVLCLLLFTCASVGHMYIGLERE